MSPGPHISLLWLFLVRVTMIYGTARASVRPHSEAPLLPFVTDQPVLVTPGDVTLPRIIAHTQRRSPADRPLSFVPRSSVALTRQLSGGTKELPFLLLT